MRELIDYLQIELSIPGLDEEKVQGVPIWRLVRTPFRWMARDARPFTVTPNIKLGEVFLNTWRSFWGLTRLALFGRKTDAIFFPHPRLFYVDGLYLERLSDPLIDAAGMDNYLILERNQNGVHKRPRYHDSHVVYLDFIDVSVRCLSFFVMPVIKRRYNSQVEALFSKLDNALHLNDDKYKALIFNIITNFLISKSLIAPILRKLHPRLVFFAPRGTYDYATAYCKQMGVTTVELQHGIVLRESDLYTSASYNPDYDPDYFLVFGESNIGPQYGMPVERVLNMGFPYKIFLKSLHRTSYDDNTALVASETEISDKIINVLIDIVVKYPQFRFHIRCHPQEKLSENHYTIIAGYPQIEVVDNLLESFCALSQYSVVVGEMSSVLFEAMSLHKKVARLNYGGLHAVETELIHGGTVINSADDYFRFMTNTYLDENDSKELYSDYNPEIIQMIMQ